jgi:hypothetical protein
MSTTTQRLPISLVATMFIVLIALMATVGVRSADAATESETVVDRQPVSFDITNPCNGELIPMTGYITTVFHYTNNAHTEAYLTQNSFQASGVGEITGARYQLNSLWHETIALHTGIAYTFTNHENVIGEGQVPDFIGNTIFHFTLTPSGMSVEVVNESGECKG